MTETETINDPRDYKIAALKERISQLVADYEDKDANRRVEITMLTLDNNRLREELANAQKAAEDADSV